MVYNEAWDETAEEIVSTPSSGGESDTFGDCENRDYLYFSHVGGRSRLWTLPTTA